MKIRCSRCGSGKFFYTSPKREKVDNPDHHGACCAHCQKPIDLRDLIPRFVAFSEKEKSYAE
ncbi:hypothetical protein [Pantoea sp.]|uniref:hypothetical protein n=1 Tax=Pantoea sp. TaxID=69393 RepID=UPI0031DF56C9